MRPLAAKGFALLLGVCASSVQAGGGMSARDALEQFSMGLETFNARFLQQVISQDGEVVEQGDGEVWLRHPNLFRWYYEGDFPELIVADGQRVWVFDESLEQVTVREQSGVAGDTPLMLLTDVEGLDEQFRVTELGTVTGQQMLELEARHADSQFEHLVLGFQGGVLERLVLEDAFGMRTELTFSHIERNPDIPASHFRFTPPEGVDVIGEEELIGADAAQ